MIILILAIPIILIVAFEFSSRVTFGRIISEHDLNTFLAKHLNGYTLNEQSNTLLYHSNLPFISKSCPCVSYKWYIENYGRIPRWSKWSRKIDEHFESVNKSRTKKVALRDL